MSTATVSPKVAAQHELQITRVFDAPRELVWKSVDRSGAYEALGWAASI